MAVNYANDYSDGKRGTDADRVGPMRLVGSGAAAPRQVLVAAGLAFAVAAVAGLGLAALSSWWLVAVGAVCIAAAWTYTGGPLPYGYRALGEVFVFVFFGLVAVVGTTYAQTGTLPGLAFAVSVPVGLLIVALLVVNNLRDIEGDALVGKRTLAVLLGERAHPPDLRRPARRRVRRRRRRRRRRVPGWDWRCSEPLSRCHPRVRC